MTQHTLPQNRMAYFDNIRSLMIVLVVALHTAVTYSDFGDWYYNEPGDQDMLSSLSFALFLTWLQAFFMSMLFMIAGYFSALAMEKKSVKQFISGRLFRLGIPVLFYIVIIHPINIKMIWTDLDMVEFFINGIKSGNILSWTGPLWFAQALLIFSLIYAAKRKLFPNLTLKSFSISLKTVLFLGALITLMAFSIRQIFPIGSSVLNLQFSFFSAYIVFYIVGILTYQNKAFESLGAKTGKQYIMWSLILGLPYWFALMLLGGPAQGHFLIDGGLHWQAFAYALWESFICVTFCFGLVGIFHEKLNSQNKLQKFMSDHAFGVYVFHAPILIACSLLLKDITIYPLLKFCLVGVIVIPCCFIFSWIINKVPVFKKVFA